MGNLAKTDAEAAYEAMLRLEQASADSTLPLLEKLFNSAKPRGPTKFAALVADLDSDEFDVREKASAALAKAGIAALPELRKAMKSSPSVEVRRRVQEILEKLDADDWVPPEELRLLRLVEILERIGTPAAEKLLEQMAKEATVSDVAEQCERCWGG